MIYIKKGVCASNTGGHTYTVGVAGTGRTISYPTEVELIGCIDFKLLLFENEKERKEQEMLKKMAEAIVEYDKINDSIYLDKSLYRKKGKEIKNWNKTKFYQK